MPEKVSFTQSERDLIESTASNILAHSSFRSSERSTRFFQYLLDRALSDESEHPKERQIGHEVFGREISYDTSGDPVVRNAASETRKRLRQYDAESGSHAAVHILLMPGSYVLDIRFSESGPPLELSSDVGSGTDNFGANEVKVLHPTQTVLQARRWRNPNIFIGIALVSIACCLFFAFAFFRQKEEVQQVRSSPRVNDPLWSPVFASGKEVFICLGHPDPLGSEGPVASAVSGGLQRVTVTDLKAYTNIVEFLQLSGQTFQMRTDREATLLDLRDRPAVLIGNHNNDWALRLEGNLRFRFDWDEAHSGKPHRMLSIFDSQQPTRRWEVPLLDAKVDYAIAGRFFDPTTGGLVIYVAGIGAVGTEAASEFITQPQFLRGLPESLKNPRTNFEVVLKTPIIGGVAGSPELVATQIW